MLRKIIRNLSTKENGNHQTSVINMFLSKKLGFRINDGHSCVITDTPFQQKIKSNSVLPKRVPNTMGTLYISKKSGSFACTDSGLTGNWEELQRILSENQETIKESRPIHVSREQLYLFVKILLDVFQSSSLGFCKQILIDQD